jgi:hypothetical protein
MESLKGSEDLNVDEMTILEWIVRIYSFMAGKELN